MKDRIQKKGSSLKVQTVLGAVKERLVEHRFNIDLYDIKNGTLRGRRNSLDKMVLGLYRNIKVAIDKDEKTGDLEIELEWGGLISSNVITFLLIFFISYALFKGVGLLGLLYSIPIAMVFVMVNLALFMVLRTRVRTMIRKDILDLEKEESRRNRSAKRG